MHIIELQKKLDTAEANPLEGQQRWQTDMATVEKFQKLLGNLRSAMVCVAHLMNG